MEDYQENQENCWVNKLWRKREGLTSKIYVKQIFFLYIST